MPRPPQTLHYESLPSQPDSAFSSGVTLRVANHTLSCPNAVRYLPDPRFTGFTSTRVTADQLLLIIKVGVW